MKLFIIGYPAAFLIFASVILTRNFFPEMTHSDWGTWVGSIGTVATLIGTIYLATTETRQRNLEEEQKASLSAASLTPRIEAARYVTSQVVSAIEVAIKSNFDAKKIIPMGKHLQTLDLWTLDEIRPLVTLPNGCALFLAIAAEKIRNWGTAFVMAESNGLGGPRDQKLEFLNAALKDLQRTTDALMSAKKICEDAAATSYTKY